MGGIFVVGTGQGRASLGNGRTGRVGVLKSVGKQDWAVRGCGVHGEMEDKRNIPMEIRTT